MRAPYLPFLQPERSWFLPIMTLSKSQKGIKTKSVAEERSNMNGETFERKPAFQYL